MLTEDEELEARILVGAINQGLSLHELRHIVALFDIGMPKNAESELRSLLKQAEELAAKRHGSKLNVN